MEDYKEKYKQAMLRMNKWVEGSEIIDPKEVAEFVFPELKESEDEMVRKHLLKHFRNKTKEDWNGMPVKNILDWFEKQDPKKHEEELEKAYKTADEVQYRKGYEDAKREFEKQGKSDAIVENAKTEKQRVLVTESDGNANINWDCRSIDDVEALLNCGLEYIRSVKANKQIVPDHRFGRHAIRVPSKWDKLEKQGGKKFPSLGEKEIVCLKRILDFLREEHNSYTGKDFTNEIAVLEWLIIHPVLIHSSELQQNQCEQKPAWSEEEEEEFQIAIGTLAKAGQHDSANWLKSLKERVQPKSKQEWSEEDEKMWSTISDLLWEGYKLSDKKVSWNKIRCWLLPKITYFKDRVQTHPKQEWSEKDEKTFRSLSKALARISSNTRTDSTSINYSFFIEIEWLKSLKERYTWKPSEEQMKALNYVINLMASSESPTENDYYYNVFKDMRTQLKKLR